MTRNDHIRQYFSKDMVLVEIGPSYNPIIPKADGWKTTVIDHADRATLVEKYGNLADPAIIEDVDVVWHGGALSDAVPATMLGTFDGMISSHSAEHMPDLIGFLQAAGKLLKSTGVFFLALPDKRLCFDFFQPHSTTGNVIDGMGRERHSIGCLWDHAAYYTHRGENSTWGLGGEVVPFQLVHPLTITHDILKTDTNAGYIDAHKWRFTPASFQLLIFELNLLRLIPWAIAHIEPAPLVEFYVMLERRMITLPQAKVEEERLRLVREIIMETKTQVAQLEIPAEPVVVIAPPPEVPAEPEKPILTISAVIPLYNGARFIQESITSILTQSLLPNEIIVVDDGSTDNGPALVREMAEQYPMITLLTKENGGQSSARNYGVAHSTGDLIALLDQDDVWYRDHLDELIKPFLEPSAGRELGWVYSNLDEMDTEGNMVGHNFLRVHRTPHPKHDMFECLREDMFVLPSASLVLRKAFDEVGGFDERLSGYEDDDLFLRLFRAGYGNEFLETSLSKWRIYPESSSYSYRMRRSRAVYFRKLWETYQDDPSRARWIKRDLLIPRFYVQALSEYVKAVRTRQPHTVIEETRAELQYIVDRMPGWKRRMFGRMLSRLESERFHTVAWKLRRFARPIYRRLI